MNFPYCTFRRQSRMGNLHLRRRSPWGCILPGLWLAAWLWAGWEAGARGQSLVEIAFFDKESGAPISARLEFVEPFQRFPRPLGALVVGRQILVEDTARLKIAPGKYEFMVRRGPEVLDVRSGFEAQRNARNRDEVHVPRKSPMRRWGWYSGDLLGAASAETTRRWMRADDLDLAATIDGVASSVADKAAFPPGKGAPAADQGDAANTPPRLDQVQGGSVYFPKPGQGGLLIHRLANAVPEEASPWGALAEAAKEEAAHVELTKPWDRDVPLLLATQQLDSIQLLSGYLLPDSSLPIPPAAFQPDPLRFRGKKGLGRLAEFLYWQMLEAGFRLPPTAGSGFDGKTFTYLGYNRVYAFLPLTEVPTPDRWWQQLRAGHTVVTNGPLLKATVNEQPPGSIFYGQGQEGIDLDMNLELTVRDPVEYLDVIFNGKAIYQAKLEEHARRGRFPDLKIQRSGWLVLRVVTSYEDSYRLATTAPFYFEFDGKPRIAKEAVGLFQEWLAASLTAIDQDVQLQADTEAAAAYRRAGEQAMQFWRDRGEMAQAE